MNPSAAKISALQVDTTQVGIVEPSLAEISVRQVRAAEILRGRNSHLEGPFP